MIIIAKNKEAIQCINVFYEAFDETTLLSLLNKINDMQQSNLVYEGHNVYTGNSYTYYELECIEECVDSDSTIFDNNELSLIHLFAKYEVNLKIKFPSMELIDIEAEEYIFY